MKYSLLTFGCRVNQADSLGFEEALRLEGASPARLDEADLVIVNTCSVTASADQGARQAIRRIARSNPGARIVVTGCYATRDPDAVRSLPHVVTVVPNDDKPRLISLIQPIVRSVRLQPDLAVRTEPQPNLSTAERFGDGEGSCGAPLEPGAMGRTAFTLRVQTGCAEACTYCIIPSTRGAPQSLAVAVVLAEVERVVAAGFKEIVLTGVHLGSYGRDLMPATTLSTLLTALAEQARGSDALFRISSLEPMDCSPEIVALVAEHPSFAPHFHLPLQHASQDVLAAMRRPYTVEQYDRLVGDIRSKIPTASIGSDIIVGFPHETDEDFRQLREYLDQSPLTHLHVFPYSDRPGTVATKLKGKVHGSVIRERAGELRAIGHRLTTRFHESQVGTVHRALTIDDGSMAVTDNYLKVRIGPGRRRNEWVQVRVTSAGATLTGEVC